MNKQEPPKEADGEKGKLDADMLQKLIIMKLLLQAGVENCDCSDCALRREKEKQEQEKENPKKEEKIPPPRSLDDMALQNKIQDLEKRMDIAEFLLTKLFTSPNKSCK